MVVGAVRGAAIADLAGRMRKRVPDRTAPAVFTDGAFDLVGGRGGAPYKTVRETARAVAARGLTILRPRRRRRQSERGKSRQLRKVPAREFSEHRLLRSGLLCNV